MNTVSPSSTAVVGVLLHWDGTENRSILIHDIVITQRTLFELAQKAIPGVSWSVSKKDTVGLARREKPLQPRKMTPLALIYFMHVLLLSGPRWDNPGTVLVVTSNVTMVSWVLVT